MLNTVLIANRGVIATRILRTLRSLNIRAVVVYAEADANAPYVSAADEAYSLGDGSASDTYLNIEKLLDVAHRSKADAVHPGYGFLSENTTFIEACDNAGLIFLGPTKDQVNDFGYKHRARELAEASGVPLVPGSGLLANLDEARTEAKRIGFPVILKSTAGGGGIGMHVCSDLQHLEESFDTVRSLGERNFGNGAVYLEAYIAEARHVEVQIFGDGCGNVVALGERDCSTQRRNQKVLEECPAPALSDKIRGDLCLTAIKLGESVKYRNAGTVEFVYDVPRSEFYFLEVNTRLQVEHGVTEMVWKIDLVEWMVRLGRGDLGDLKVLRSQLKPEGHAIQARVYAEDPVNDFMPCAGLITSVSWPSGEGIRIDTALEAGLEVTPRFDPMLAKVIAWAPSRTEAVEKLATVLENTQIYGITTNCGWLSSIVRNPVFKLDEPTFCTRWLASAPEWMPSAFDVISPGTLTTIQDFPGRQGYWDVGVPPSGPFDDWSFRLGNRLLGNDSRAAGIEVTVMGPTIKFLTSTQIVIAGFVSSKLDGEPIQPWTVVDISMNSTLSVGRVVKGMRAYVLFKGSIYCPEYLGSRSTFTLGEFGGHAGRALRTGDRIELRPTSGQPIASTSLPQELLPAFPTADGCWEIAVLYGPHGSPDFFTNDDISALFSHEYEVHYNSSRTGVRLIGPRPTWVRADGGEAGLHPSNIHDNAYAFGTLDFTGDMPIILGPDGPSLGGFVCPVTIIRAERWKIGQLAPGNRVKFVPVSVETARDIENQQLSSLSRLTCSTTPPIEPFLGSPIIRQANIEEAGVEILYRQAGDDFVLVEFGSMELDIALRFRAHAWMLWLQEHRLKGIVDLTPGIRSLQVHFDPLVTPRSALIQHLKRAEMELREVESLEVETREICLPLSWNDEACQEAIDKYQRSVRPGAPWCPSNLEFIRRINGLNSIEDVRKVVFDANYLVMGLGDVYLGAPVATPLDPTQRLVTTKYNPARTWTAENSVGIGGAYLCVYGMEGPGGYQFVGRTLQMWNRYFKTPVFEKPWLLRFFDQLRFYPVSHQELMDIRRDFPRGRYQLQMKPIKFRLADYLKQLEARKDEIAKFKERRDMAFQNEIAEWRATGQFTFEDNPVSETVDELELADGEVSVDSPVPGNLWKLLVSEGDIVSPGRTVAILESMKMEIPIVAAVGGKVTKLPISVGSMISSGQAVVVIKEN